MTSHNDKGRGGDAESDGWGRPTGDVIPQLVGPA